MGVRRRKWLSAPRNYRVAKSISKRGVHPLGLRRPRACDVKTEHTMTMLQDTTQYQFIILATNMGGKGGIEAPYNSQKKGAGHIRDRSAHLMFQGSDIVNSGAKTSQVFT